MEDTTTVLLEQIRNGDRETAWIGGKADALARQWGKLRLGRA